MNTKGDWVKVTGGNNGAYFDGRKWIAFDCMYCARVDGLIPSTQKKRLGDRSKQLDMANRREPKYRCRGSEHHKLFYARER